MTFAEILPGLLAGKRYQRPTVLMPIVIAIGGEWVVWSKGQVFTLMRADLAATDWQEVVDG